MNKKLKNIETKLITGVFLGLFIFCLFFFWGDFQKVKSVMATLGMNAVLFAVFSTLFSYIVRFYKWQFLLNRTHIHIPKKESLVVFFIGMSMSITPGKIGELVKAYLLKKRFNIDFFHSSSAVFVDRFTDLFAMLFLVGLGVSLFSLGKLFFILCLLFLVLLYIILRSKKFSHLLIGLFCKLSLLKNHKDKITTLYENTYQLLNVKTFLITVFISIIAWLFECFSLHIFILEMDLDLSFTHSIFIFSLGTLAGALSMVPGGLAIAEASIVGMFMYFDIDKSIAVSITLLIRLVTLWLGVWIGLVLFVIHKKRFSFQENEV